MSSKIRQPQGCTLMGFEEKKRRFECDSAIALKPYYISILEKFGTSTISWLSTLLVLALGPYIIWVLCVTFTGNAAVIRTAWYMMFFPAIIFAGLSLLHHAYYLMVNPRNMHNLLAGICDDEGLKNFQYWLKVLFIGRAQWLFLISFATVAICNIIRLTPSYLMTLNFSIFFYVFYIFYVVYTVFLVGPGVWVAITSMFWINAYSSPSCLQIQALRPHRHSALRVAGSIISTYALSFSLEASLVLSAFFAFEWQQGQYWVTVVRIMWVITIIPLIVMLFAYPQYKIKQVIIYAKESIMDDLEKHINDQYYNYTHKSVEELEKLVRYIDLQDKLQAEKNYTWDIAVLTRFFSAIIVPFIVATLQLPNIVAIPQALSAIWSYLQHFGK